MCEPKDRGGSYHHHITYAYVYVCVCLCVCVYYCYLYSEAAAVPQTPPKVARLQQPFQICANIYCACCRYSKHSLKSCTVFSLSIKMIYNMVIFHLYSYPITQSVYRLMMIQFTYKSYSQSFSQQKSISQSFNQSLSESSSQSTKQSCSLTIQSFRQSFNQ